MTITASGRAAALLAIGLLLGFAGVSQAATGGGAIGQATAGDTTNQPRTDAQVVASDQLNDVDRALQPPSITPAPATQPDAQVQSDVSSQSAVPAAASSDEGSGGDMTALIGKIFIAFGSLLTLGSSAARMIFA
jgi:hypothetical protein